MKIEVQGHEVHVEQSGKGPPALFLHGVPDSAELWQPVIEGVADRYTCIAPDLMGIHRSEVNPGFDYSGDGFADWTESLVAALAVTEPLTLVVHDWGGLIGLAWASKYPQRIARIVVCNTVFVADYRWHAWAKVWRTPLLGELSMALMNKAIMTRELRRGSRLLTPAQLQAMWEATPANPASRKVILKMYRSVDPSELDVWAQRYAELARQRPVKVVWGAHDPYIPQRFALRFGTDDVEIVEDSGHWVPAERPDRVIAALRET